MIEIVNGTLEEQIIKILQKTYPVTIKDLEKQLHISYDMINRVLQKFQIKGIVQLEPLPNKTFIRLIRRDFRFVGKKRQKKFIKHRSGKKSEEPGKYDGMMFS
jgi:predicted transcriptional regulator